MTLTPQVLSTLTGTGIGALIGYKVKKNDEDLNFLNDEEKAKTLLLSALKGGLMGGGVGFTSGFFMDNN